MYKNSPDYSSYKYAYISGSPLKELFFLIKELLHSALATRLGKIEVSLDYAFWQVFFLTLLFGNKK